MSGITRKTEVLTGITPDAIPYDALMEEGRPKILKGVVRDWPLVQRGLKSPDAAIDYILSYYQGRPVVGYTGAPDIKGRFFYTDDMSALNFSAERVALPDFLDRLKTSPPQPEGPAYYIGSTDIDAYLPGLRAENDLVLNSDMFVRCNPLVSIWMGNRTMASTHYDMSNNMACCVVGRRRFTLFPPDQVANLYPGPLEPTPGGQVVSMVDINDPDLERFPAYAKAQEAAQIADLEPGDMLIYPALWWHNVEAFDEFNVLINYWWNDVPGFMDTPMNTLLHGLLSLRDRPQAEKEAWKAMFDFYVFGEADRAARHLPEKAQGALAPMDMMSARRLRAQLLAKLNR